MDFLLLSGMQVNTTTWVVSRYPDQGKGDKSQKA